ncbi:MAG: BREX-1 system phosphatase PglZ type A [Clostridiales bacterium]|nr:BREX-1 system phosphatase PglZ type A [Clostridiales bacterium]
MAELNLQQIIDRLNAEFTGDTRKLVFWYDDNADFAEEIQDVVLDNAKVYFLRPDNQFYTKYLLEREDTTTNYLIYAPFPKPDVRENHLEDTLLYSRRFYADRASLLCVDLGISEKYKPVIEKHVKFFGSKERTKRFYDLEIERFNEETILTGLICAICRTRICSFEEALRVILTDKVNSGEAGREGGLGHGESEENAYLAEMDKYGLTAAFWKLCEQQFGYTDADPSLEKLLVTMFVTYTDKYVQAALPKAWNTFVSLKPGNIIAFLDSVMNSVLYREKYDALSDHVAAGLNVRAAFAGMQPEDLTGCDTFRVVDKILSRWLVGRLVAEDTGAALNGQTIPQICESRMKLHFGTQNEDCYLMLESAYRLVCANNYHSPDGFANIIKTYREKDCLLDQEYRHFYYHYDRMDDTADFEELRTLVENIYTNEYLTELLPRRNQGIQEPDSLTELTLQRNFYNRFVRSAMSKERTVVIISDAMRYEVGQELFLRMQDDPKSTVKLDAMLSVLPSYTRLGMAALLPQRTLTMTDDYKVLADDTLCDSLSGRQTVLQSYCPDSDCVQFDDIKTANQAKLRSVFTGKQVVYVYHNQIDARGDKANTEDEVFVACEEAIQEIMDLIWRISSSANTHRFLITADHGFIYKRDKLMESDKMNFAVGERLPKACNAEGGLGHKIDVGSKKAFVNRRFIVAKEPVSGDGVLSITMGRVLGNDDEKIVSFPVGSNVFKVAGGGTNYVHGGSSPQEMLVPVIDIKMQRGHMETRPAQIALVSIVPKITNLIVSMDFIQSDAVTDTVKGTTYRLYFVSEDGERISNENTFVADSRETDAAKRMTRLCFTFKNQKYDRNRQYYLVACDKNSGLEAWRHPVIMDLAFGDDFGFGF